MKAGLAEMEGQQIVSKLTQIYLQDMRDSVTRKVLEAASVVRRTTRSLLTAMVPDISATCTVVLAKPSAKPSVLSSKLGRTRCRDRRWW
jgi:hypothetical protein